MNDWAEMWYIHMYIWMKHTHTSAGIELQNNIMHEISKMQNMYSLNMYILKHKTSVYIVYGWILKNWPEDIYWIHDDGYLYQKAAEWKEWALCECGAFWFIGNTSFL